MNNPRKKSPKPQKYITERIYIEKLIPGGQALGTLENGKKIFLWNALPGETVTRAAVLRQKSSYIKATAIDIENPATERVEPRDACYLSTSPWQILNYDYELSLKRDLLIEMFRQQGITDIDIPAVETDGRDYQYRNKMEYALFYSHEDEKIRPAVHARGSHQKLIVETSSLERPEIFQAACGIIDELNARHADARNYQSLLLRASQSGQVSGGLYENHHPHPVFMPLSDTILGHQYSYSPNGFFQINLPVYEMALRKIASHIQTEKVLDLYAGVGTIGLSVARDHDLTLVECDGNAYKELVKNCDSTGAKPILSKSEEALGYIAPDQSVILDPPRAGCDHALIEKLLEVKPPTIIYLSCNPITQARDAALLMSAYHISEVTPYNFFPHTPHLENLIILRSKHA